MTDVVITVPAYFDDAQRRATLRAGELAGLQVLRLLNEPTSAALCYEQLGALGDAGPELVLVYDLGGGTFDVSVLEIFDSVREVRATAGDTRLGGDDFDQAIVGLFLDALRNQSVDPQGDAHAMARLRRVAEETKIRLSSDTRVLVREDFVATEGGRSIHLELEVTRRAFEKLIDAHVTATLAHTRKAIADAGVTPAEIARLCLVGGSTRIPLVRQRLEEELGIAVHEEIDPDLAVGLGASLQAAMLRDETVDRILVDVSAHSLGMRTIGDDDDGYAPPDTFSPVLRRNTVLPATRVEEFYTAVDRQAELEVEVFQGERPRASENTPLGSFRCKLAPRPERSPVRVAFAYDLNGIVRVSVSQPDVPGEHTAELTVADAYNPLFLRLALGRAPDRKAARAALATFTGEGDPPIENFLLAAKAAQAGGLAADAAAIRESMRQRFAGKPEALARGLSSAMEGNGRAARALLATALLEATARSSAVRTLLVEQMIHYAKRIEARRRKPARRPAGQLSLGILGESA